ncbi:MAG: hypothetical protein EOO77_28920 [Oxalobacteraceae bacterium]|nr:MAG: hypothetical protein EOO77_28920 [Oxalobacteraceae bacterium]
MAKEIYAFDLGDVLDIDADPRVFHQICWQMLGDRHPMLKPFSSMPGIYLTYCIIGVYASGNIDLRLFLNACEKDQASAIKLILP